jgi:hypothetical protein
MFSAFVVLVAGCSSPSTPKASTSAPSSMFVVQGSAFINGVGSADPTDLTADYTYLDPGSSCYGINDFQDIDGNASIVVSDNSGHTVAIGRFSDSKDSNSTVCTLNFTVKDVPSGLKFYSVKVAHRPSQKFTEAELHQPLTIPFG